jgi:hypothetical protein
MTYDLRHFRLHGIIERIPHSHRYQLTAEGLRIALFFSRTYARLLRPKLAQIMPVAPPIKSALRIAFDRLNSEIDACAERNDWPPKPDSFELHFWLCAGIRLASGGEALPKRLAVAWGHEGAW